MFDQTFVPAHGHARKPWTIAASLVVQTLVAGALLVVPLLHPEILHPKIEAPLFVHLQPLHEIVRVEATRAPVRATALRAFVAPVKIPDGVKKVVDTNPEPALESFAVMGPPSGNTSVAGIFSDLIQGGIPDAPPAPRPAPQARPTLQAQAGPVEVSKGVQAAKLIFGPKPAYPTLAKAARVQGTVRIQAIIATDGSIGNLKAMSGPALLIPAALEAVARWRYQPTLLNSRAVEVITEIDVIFTLSQ
jgi:protein TonB